MIEVKRDDSFIPSLEDEAFEVEHLLAEPKKDHVSVDGVLHSDKGSQGKCFDTNDFPFRFGNGIRNNCGVMTPNTNLEGGGLNFGDLDGFLDEVEEVEGIDATNVLSTPCDDYLLDIEFDQQVSELEFGPCEGSHLGSSSSESQSPGFSGLSNGAVGILESSTEFITERDRKNSTHEKKVICELHGARKSKCCCQTPVKDNLDELDNDTCYNGNMKNPIEARKNGALKQKRMRKPTRRYIEESSALKSQHLKGSPKFSTTPSKDKSLKVENHNENHHKRLREVTLVKAEDSVCGTSVQTPFESRVRRGRPKKHASIPTLSLQSDEDSSTTESEDDFVTAKRPKGGGDRRKHQRMWTLSEVTKLVDGISHYGVGRWTEIKRILFSSSAYRTPIDLRDKWRNLLRASRAHKQSRREVDNKQNHALRPLPKSMLCRISELAKIHPYPKEQNSKHTSRAASPNLQTASKGAPSNLSRITYEEL